MSLKERIRKDFLGADYVMSDSASEVYEGIKDWLNKFCEIHKREEKRLEDEKEKYQEKLEELKRLEEKKEEYQKKLEKLERAEEKKEKYQKKLEEIENQIGEGDEYFEKILEELNGEVLEKVKKSNLVRVTVPNSNGKIVANVFITKEEANVDTIKKLKSKNFSKQAKGGKLIKAALEKAEERALAKSLGKAIEESDHIKKGTPIAEALRPLIFENIT